MKKLYQSIIFRFVNTWCSCLCIGLMLILLSCKNSSIDTPPAQIEWQKTNFNYSVWSLTALGQTILAGTDRNGVWRSTDNGTTWLQLFSDSIPALTPEQQAKVLQLQQSVGVDSVRVVRIKPTTMELLHSRVVQAKLFGSTIATIQVKEIEQPNANDYILRGMIDNADWLFGQFNLNIFDQKHYYFGIRLDWSQYNLQPLDDGELHVLVKNYSSYQPSISCTDVPAINQGTINTANIVLRQNKNNAQFHKTHPRISSGDCDEEAVPTVSVLFVKTSAWIPLNGTIVWNKIKDELQNTNTYLINSKANMKYKLAHSELLEWNVTDGHPDFADPNFQSFFTTNEYDLFNKIGPLFYKPLNSLYLDEKDKPYPLTLDEKKEWLYRRNFFVNNTYLGELRSKYKADIIVVLVFSKMKDCFNCQDRVAHGIASRVGPYIDPEQKDNNFVLLAWETFQGSNYLLPHEIGHILGGRHAYPPEISSTGCGATDSKQDDSHGHCVDSKLYFGEVKTIMTTTTNSPVYSNPNINFPLTQIPAGGVRANVVKHFNQNAPIVAATQKIDPSPILNGPNEVKNGDEITLTIDNLPACYHPSEVKWYVVAQKSIRAYKYGNITVSQTGTPGHSMTITIDDFFPFPQLILVMALGQTKDGETFAIYKNIYSTGSLIDFPTPIPPLPLHRSVGEDEFSMKSTKVKLFQNIPNPLNDKTEILYQISESIPTGLSICDIYGREVMKVEETNKQTGVHTFILHTTGLAPGVYSYRLISRGWVLATKQMIIIK